MVRVYDLQSSAPQAAQLSPSQQALRNGISLFEPTALQALDSDRVAVRQRDGSLAYLGGVQWADRLPRLVQARFIKAFEARGIAAGRTSDAVTSSRLLSVDIRRFELAAPQGEVMIELSLKLQSSPTSLQKAQIFIAEPVVASLDANGVATLEAALAQVVDDAVAWAMAK